jgi:ABC-type sugar transport system substrate-binding protein
MKRMCVLTMAFLVATMLLPTAALAADPELTVGMIYISPVQIPWSAAHQTGFKQALDAIFGGCQDAVLDGDYRLQRNSRLPCR